MAAEGVQWSVNAFSPHGVEIVGPDGDRILLVPCGPGDTLGIEVAEHLAGLQSLMLGSAPRLAADAPGSWYASGEWSREQVIRRPWAVDPCVGGIGGDTGRAAAISDSQFGDVVVIGSPEDVAYAASIHNCSLLPVR